MGKYKKFVGLGIAGNFALHLEQAGELEDFKDVITAEEAAPKGVFPFFYPRITRPDHAGTYKANEQLHTYPLGSEYIKIPADASINVQAEPEVALICDITYNGTHIDSLTPTYFGAYNDVSLRVKGASKISEKKNWGHESKGFSNQLIKIDKFEEGGNIDSYSICSFLERDGELHAYGEDVELTDYSYFHTKLIDWITNQINTQNDSGPLECVIGQLEACEFPKEMVISIGATRYTEYGENTYLQEGDKSIVVVYNHDKLSSEEVMTLIKEGSYEHEAMSVLAQKVIKQTPTNA
jgi:hypothetical protein